MFTNIFFSACLLCIDTRTGSKLILRNDINFNIDLEGKVPIPWYMCQFSGNQFRCVVRDPNSVTFIRDPGGCTNYVVRNGVFREAGYNGSSSNS